MQFILTALLAFLTFKPATEVVLNTPLFNYLATLRALSPATASVAGVDLIWPAIFFLACFGLVQVLRGGLGLTANSALHGASLSGASASAGDHMSIK